MKLPHHRVPRPHSKGLGFSRGLRRGQVARIKRFLAAFVALIVLALIRRKKSNANSHFELENASRRPGQQPLAVVFPFTTSNSSVLLTALKKWSDVGSPCSESLKGQVGIHFLQNIEDPSFNSEVFLANALALPLLTKYKSCFSTVSILNARLTGSDDVYPAGPSNMFFTLFSAPHLRSFATLYGSFFWVEWDVQPLKPLWVDCLVSQASLPDFWVRGSMLKGAELDPAVLQGANNDWISHINGNALYKLGDPDFLRFLEVTFEYEPLGHFWKPFDISIWRVLHAFPYSWRLYQTFRHKFQHSNFIAHYGFSISDTHLDFARHHEDVFFVHGSPSSSGKTMYEKKFQNTSYLFENVWDDSVLPSDDISVLISTQGADAPFTEAVVESIKKYVQNAKEIVVLVPKEDKVLFAEWPSRHEIVLKYRPQEGGLDEKQHQIYTALHADTYCRGRFIFHLDSNAFLFRKVFRRDLFWRKKPVLKFDVCKNLPRQVAFWQNGTSKAIGKAVLYDFTRSQHHLFPREIYAAARLQLRNRYRTTIAAFLSTRIVVHDDVANVDVERAFHVFNYLGAFLWHYHKELISWCPVDGVLALTEEFPSPLLPSLTCQANSELANLLNETSSHVEAIRFAIQQGECYGMESDVMRLEILREALDDTEYDEVPEDLEEEEEEQDEEEEIEEDEGEEVYDEVDH